MNNNTVNIDSTSVDRLLDALDDPDVKNKILFDAVNEGAKVLQSKTIDFFRARVGEVAEHISRWKNRPFWQGITTSKDKAYCETKVSIMGDHRLKWFEKGTQDRYTKGYKIVGYQRNRRVREGKGHWVGRMTDNNFFRDARKETSAIDAAMEQSIRTALSKLNK